MGFFFISVIWILIDNSLRSSRAVLSWQALIFTTQLLCVLVSGFKMLFSKIKFLFSYVSYKMFCRFLLQM